MDKNYNKTYIVNPGGRLLGELLVSGDKSISHRAIILGSIAEGTTNISGFLECEDTLCTVEAFRSLGVKIEGPINGNVSVHGVGVNGLRYTDKRICLGNSGTAIRLLSGLLVGQNFDSILIGDLSLSRRPMRRIIDPLNKMGASIDSNRGYLPLNINRVNGLTGITYTSPVASAQVKSCILLAGIYARGITTIIEPTATRDHTELMLQSMGYNVHVDGGIVTIKGGMGLVSTKIEIPTDISSATFFIVGAAISEGSDITLRHVGINPRRIGVINILRLMGANISLFNKSVIGGETVADLRVRYASLKGIDIPADQVPLAIDEFPAIFIAAACADGKTVLTGAEELRVKESDRIKSMVDGLNILGIDVLSMPNGVVIHGGSIGSGEVESYGDHRIAMSFSIAGLRSCGTIKINNCANVSTSFPNFVSIGSKVGLDIHEIDD